MTITQYDQFSDGGYEGKISRFHDDVSRGFLSPLVFQITTITFVTGDADPAWSTLVTNSATGESVTVPFSPVDSAGDPSAVAADAAATLHRAWNSNGQALTFARATLSGAVVTLTFNNIQVHTVVTTEDGAGAATDLLISSGGAIKAFGGRWQFWDSTVAIPKGEKPSLISALSQTSLLNIAGVAHRPVYSEQPTDELNDHWRIGSDVACLRRGQIELRVTEAVTPASDVHIVTGAGVNLGLTAASGGLDISAFAKFTVNAAAGELTEVYYDLATAR